MSSGNEGIEPLPKRKHVRLKGYDYSQNGCYFITVCTKDRKPLLSRIVGRDDLGAPIMQLTEIGAMVDQYLHAIPEHYPNVILDHHVIMPNHIHLLLRICSGAPGTARPTITQIIAVWKRLTNKEAGISLWQASFHDHVVRNDADYDAHWVYIDGNPARWDEDEYYTESNTI